MEKIAFCLLNSGNGKIEDLAIHVFNSPPPESKKNTAKNSMTNTRRGSSQKISKMNSRKGSIYNSRKGSIYNETIKSNGTKIEIPNSGAILQAVGQEVIPEENEDEESYDLVLPEKYHNQKYTLINVANTKIPRIRFITSHPWDFTDRMINVIRDYPNIMPYVHLPLQSGSNKILKLMGRKYTKEEYKYLYDKLRKIPNVSITTDIIVGFPGESEEDFMETLEMVQYCKYDSAFTFIYSPRVGTPAAKLLENDKTKEEEKEDRLYRLNTLINEYSLNSNQKMIGKVEKVLVDGYSNKENMGSGYTENNKLVNFIGNSDIIGKIVKVKITDAKSFSLDGEQVE